VRLLPLTVWDATETGLTLPVSHVVLGAAAAAINRTVVQLTTQVGISGSVDEARAGDGRFSSHRHHVFSGSGGFPVFAVGKGGETVVTVLESCEASLARGPARDIGGCEA